MNDFQAGAGMEGAEGPLGFFEDERVEFDGNAAGVEAEGFEEGGNGEVVGDLTGLAIYYNVHRKPDGEVGIEGRRVVFYSSVPQPSI
jgi:hypothetical protein